MKFRESGMPDEEMWETFFEPASILSTLGLKKDCQLVVDVGCGYGTFLIPTAQHIMGTVIGIDVDEQMVHTCTNRIRSLGIENIELLKRDVFSDGYGLESDTADGVFLFNILHCEEPLKLLGDTYSVLKKGGSLFVAHWIYNSQTPRGPSMAIRPKPEQIIDWAGESGFVLEKQLKIGQYHYGLVFRKV